MKATQQFILRFSCLALVALCLFLYQQKASGWDQAVQENNAEIAEIQAYNQEIDAEQQDLDERIADAQQQLALVQQGLDVTAEAEADAEPAEAADTRTRWEDGSWTGSGEGFGGTITVTVTTAEDRITGLQVDSAPDEDESYLAISEGIIDSILTAQSADVDTISGATFSSTGIRTAVQDALSQAEVAP